MLRLAIRGVIFLFFIVAGNQIHAQVDDVKFQHLDAIPQLANRSITTIAQDAKGYLWLGTQDGLLRYDGYSVKSYKHDIENVNSLSDNNIRALATDTLGNLWVATQGGGLNKLILDEERFVRFEHNSEDNNTISGNSVWSLLVDSNNNLWAGTWSNGLNKLNIVSGKIERFVESTNDPVLSIYEDKEGLIYFSSEGLNVYNPETENIKVYHSNPSVIGSLGSDNIRAIAADKEGNIWLGTEDAGINKLITSDNTFEKYLPVADSSNSLNSHAIYALLVDDNNLLWAATDNGLNVWDLTTNRVRHYQNDATDPFSLSNNNPRTIFQDRSGSIWIGNEAARINKLLDRKNFEVYRHRVDNSNSLSNNVIRSLYEDTDGTVWIGTQAGGLNLLDRKNGNVTLFPSEPGEGLYVASNGVSAMHRDTEGMMWVGTWGDGLYRLDEANDSVMVFRHQSGSTNTIPDDRIQVLYKDQFDVFWVGTENGLSSYDINSDQWTKLEGLNGNTIQGKAFVEEEDGTLWIGTWNGLNRVSPDRKSIQQWALEEDNANSLSNQHIISLHLDSNKNLWIGTFGGGLNKFDIQSDKFKRYLEKDGLPNGVIYGILEDGDGQLWLGTNNGLSRFNPKTQKFRNYDASEGLQSNEFYWGGSFKNKDGSLMFGGINGLNIFDPSEIKDNTVVPPVVISDFLIYNRNVGIGQDSVLEKSISYTSSIDLSYKQSVLTFNFASLNYNHPEKNQYAYMMEGFENRWNYVGNKRTATYTNLDPGEYVFRVKASNNDNVWNEQGVSIVITVAPPFWRTWWFYGMCLVAVVAMIYTFIKYRERQLNEDKAELQKSIDEANAQVEQQKNDIRDQREKEKDRIWTDQGLVKFGEILSSRDEIDDLCHNVLKNMVSYLEVEMAAIYLSEENESGETVLIQRNNYGYTQENQKPIAIGNGLVGACYIEKETNYIDNLPKGYLKISSGLGECDPASLFLVPLTYQGAIIGVLEVASFRQISDLKRDFICTFTGRFTAALNTRLLGEKTQRLLEDSKVKARDLAVREEELQQNLEELQAMNEDTDRKTKELEESIRVLQEENERLKKAHAE